MVENQVNQMPDKNIKEGQLFWRPSVDQIEKSHTTSLLRYINQYRKLELKDYWNLHDYSLKRTQEFWDDVWDWAGILGERGSGHVRLGNYNPFSLSNTTEQIFNDSGPIDDLFLKRVPHARVNLAENALLAHPHARSKEKLACIGIVEPLSLHTQSAQVIKTLTFEQLYQEVRLGSNALRSLGLEPGDRIGAFIPNCAEAVTMLWSSVTLGTVWTSTPCEFGVQAVLERLEQVRPRVLVTTLKYRYNGKTFSTEEKLGPILKGLIETGLEYIIVINHLDPSGEVKEESLKIYRKQYGKGSIFYV